MMQQKWAMIATGTVLAATTAFVGVAAATAGAPAGQVPAHRHFVQLNDGSLVEVGPNSCEDGTSIQFDQFHLNGHLGQPGQRGVVTPRGCSFVNP